jgi:hypothetical protein
MWFWKKEKRPKVYCSKCTYYYPINGCRSPKNMRSTYRGLEEYDASSSINSRNNCKWYKEKDGK